MMHAVERSYNMEWTSDEGLTRAREYVDKISQYVHICNKSTTCPSSVFARRITGQSTNNIGTRSSL